VKSTDRTILLVVAVAGLIAAFWFMVLAPKRQDAADVADQVATLEAQVSQEEASASTATAAKDDFESNYHQLITLGKAVPVDADTPSLLTQLETLSSKSNVQFQGITLGGGGGGAAAAPATTDPLTGAPTEASVALLPIGASVGAAGLPIMPYQLDFQGGFFDIADFFGRIDGMVDAGGDTVTVNGRLLTINDFTLSPVDDKKGSLSVTVNATSYLSPADQGTTAGATPSGPLATPITPAVTPTTTAPVQPAVVGQ
jgi:Tfp pilus assembly protein PilO